MSHETAPSKPARLRIPNFKLVGFEGEEGGDDVKSAWPFDALGHTHDTMARTKGSQAERWS